MNKVLRSIKRFLGYTDDESYDYKVIPSLPKNQTSDDTIWHDRQPNNEPIGGVTAQATYMPDLNGGEEFKDFHKGVQRFVTNQLPYVGASAYHGTTPMFRTNIGIHGISDIQTSYNECGTYQYYWNEKGEYVKEYLGGINNSKL